MAKKKRTTKPTVKRAVNARSNAKPTAKGRILRGAKPAGKQLAVPPDNKTEKRRHTSEENRGGNFFSTIKMWRLLHMDGGRTIFNKQTLADRFFADLVNEEDPERESTSSPSSSGLEAELESSLGDALGDDDLGDDGGDDGGDEACGGSPSTPYNRIGEKHKRYVQRKIEALQKYGIGVDDTDEVGNVLDEDALRQRKQVDPFAERCYRYNPFSEWAEEFDTLLNAYGVTGSDLLGLMALRDLLEDMRGTPHQKSLQQLLDRMMRCVPPTLRDEAIEQARAYRHSVGNTAKYVRKASDLERWYAAALHRQQVVIDYTTPGEPMRPRHLAALSTMFHREENSIYLLGSEKTAAGWGPVRQWKMDRVDAVRMTGAKNPRLADLQQDPLVRAAPGGGRIERLDNKRVYDYSAGAWLEVGATPIRMEVLVRVPAVGHPGMAEAARATVEKAARRRAYGWMEWCREKPFHPRQTATMETLADGEKQLRLVVERCYIAEMASRLLRLQDCFEVVAPPELATAIRDYAQSIAAHHGKRS